LCERECTTRNLFLDLSNLGLLEDGTVVTTELLLQVFASAGLLWMIRRVGVGKGMAKHQERQTQKEKRKEIKYY